MQKRCQEQRIFCPVLRRHKRFRSTELAIKNLMKLKSVCMFAFTLIGLFTATLFAAEDQSLYRYPIADDSPQRLIYTAQLMGTLQRIYAPAVQAKGASFAWNFNWNQDYVGAGSNYLTDPKEFSILLFGGQVRLTTSNFEVLATTLCHEFGHFLGGPPRQMFTSGVEDWSSAEGQSDWFAAEDCLPRVYEEFNSQNSQLFMFHNLAQTENLCRNSKNPRKCQWILGAVENWAQVLDEVYEHKKDSPSLMKTDPEVVSETLHTKYPTMQCRLDTMKEANFCSDRMCERPSCWFKKGVN